MAARLLPYGERAVLAELDSLDEVLALHGLLTGADRSPALADAVPGARTVLVVASTSSGMEEARTIASRALARIAAASPEPGGDAGWPLRPDSTGAQAVVIEVTYDGADLDDVARATGLTRAEVVRAHTGQEWTVGFAGFAPGFAYLVGGDPRLRVARRSTPRARVPAGAVALAGEFSGIYPRPSPGGWQLIGSTDAPLWDAERTPPALLLPGMRVRFVDAEATS
jgi:KipI family sensor histidine kinase inhibitor